MQQPDFWQDQQKAREVAARHDALVSDYQEFSQLSQEINDNLELAISDQADSSLNLRPEIELVYTNLLARLENLEFKKLLSDKYDGANALVAIHAGAGGTDAQDWAAMLLRMYLRFCERKNWRTEILDQSKGQEAGVKSVLFKVSGLNAYGYLKNEAGVHRLVRISPFDAEKMRHTSFALVEVLPELPDVDAVELDPKEIRIDTYMSGGHGGQSVNTTYSAVRIVHEPTGITVTCQNERSQTQNKEQAMKYLKAKLWQLEWGKQQAEKKKLRGEYREAAWGNQARSYILQPYQLVKDHRTNYEENNPDSVLDGKIEGFIESKLRQLASDHK